MARLIDLYESGELPVAEHRQMVRRMNAADDLLAVAELVRNELRNTGYHWGTPELNESSSRLLVVADAAVAKATREGD